MHRPIWRFAKAAMGKPEKDVVALCEGEAGPRALHSRTSDMDRYRCLVAACFANNEGLTPFSHRGRADLRL
jgi:hypothetical protein